METEIADAIERSTEIDKYIEPLETDPNSEDVRRSLANAYLELNDSTREVSGWQNLMEKYPSVEGIQVRLYAALRRHNDMDRAIDVWRRLTTMRPTCRRFQVYLGDTLIEKDDADIAMATWWELLKANPTNLSILREFRGACDRRLGVGTRSTSSFTIPYFVWLCFLHALSDELLELWGIDEIDWWPLTSEDDYMMLSPFMVKQDWHCARPLTFLENFADMHRM